VIENKETRPYARDARARIVALYEAWGKPEKAAPYREEAGREGARGEEARGDAASRASSDSAAM